MQRVKRLRVSEVNPHLICVLCGGYYIDATTIIECLHTFCKTCIVGYLEASKHCPVCDNLVHKTKPHLRLRPDHTLQDLVYKLVPGLFQDEMKKRREFYKEEIESGRVGENGIPEERERIIYSAEEQISLVIELSSDGNAPYSTSGRSSRQPRLEAADRRYLSCPGNFTVGHLKKFIRMKFNLCDRFQMDFYHTDETLHDHYTLVDIAYIYSWRRKGPLRLYYTVYTNPAKRFKAQTEETVPMETDICDVTNISDMKTETSGYITDDEKETSEMEKSLSKESDESKHDSVLEGDGKDIEVDNKVVKVGDIKITEKEETKVINDQEHQDECRLSAEVKNKDLEIIPKLTENSEEKSNDKLDQSNKPDVKIKESGHLTDDSNVLDSKINEIDKKKDKENEPEKSVSKHSDGYAKSDGKENKHSTDKCRQEIEAKIEKRDRQEIEAKIEKRETKAKPEMVEASTGTSAVSTASERCKVQALKQSKSCFTDEDDSEHIVSSTQNTQGCQTEPPDSNSDTLELPHSSDCELVRSSVSPSCKSTVDVSCETDNFVDSVSVSTETELVKRETKVKDRKQIDCSTDVYDFPKSEESKKLPVDFSSNFDKFSMDSSKRKSLSVDCSTTVVSLQSSANKRKSMDYETNTDSSKIFKKSDSKSYRRSYSYAEQLSAPKAAYQAQPLSPTKITLKFTAPKSPVKGSAISPGAPKSPSRAETSGFQSQYQSFVLEKPKPEITYKFDEDDPPKLVKPVTIQKSSLKPAATFTKALSQLQKKTTGKSGRPRGRPPKNRSSLDVLPPPKEKKHKSRSHSPKSRNTSEKDKDRISNTEIKEKSQSAKSVSSDNSKSGNAYMFINKLESGSKQTSERKEQKVNKTSSGEKVPSDLRIPKQFLYFSNGQYTIATVSSLATLKQSSPVSPPPRTVFTSEVKTKTKLCSSDEKKAKDVNVNVGTIEIKPIENKPKEKIKTVETEKSLETEPPRIQDVEKAIRKEENKTPVKQNTNIDANQNKIVKKADKTSNQSVVTHDSVPRKSSPALNKESKTKDSKSETSRDKPSVSVPEYRHQSPFFASMSNAKLQAPHRPTTHLNIPNPSSHFSGAHQLYSPNRYASDRLGTPIYRSFSMNDKCQSAAIAKFEEARRLEAIAATSQCTYLSPFPAPYLGLMHSHLVSSLPPPPPLSKHGHYPDSCRSLSLSDTSASSLYSLSPTSAKHKNGVANQKGKEKSIDKIISAITERAKKETQEQLNGIDLSTKSSRRAESRESESKDRFDFPDDEDAAEKKTTATASEDAK